MNVIVLRAVHGLARSLKLALALCGFALAFSGCGGGESGPDLVPVTGKVTLDGSALAGATVQFIPESGSPSIGRTDDNGEYRLMYSRDKEGAMLGQHTVRISTYHAEDADEEGNTIAASPERVPIEYNLQSTLKQEVTGNGEPINFDLKSGGLIVQPENLPDDD